MNNLDPLDIQAQEQAQADREDRQRFISRQRAEDFKWLMSDKRGRRAMWWLLEQTGFYRSEVSDGTGMHFIAGMRNAGRILFDTLNLYCPDRYDAMFKEQRENDQ